MLRSIVARRDGPSIPPDAAARIGYDPSMDEWIRDSAVSDLLLFTRVVDHGGFGAAARATGVPQATLSRRVAALEERVGARLLQRTTRRASLTPAGRRYHEHGRRIAEEVAAAQAAAAQLRAEPGGPLRITAPVVLGQSFLGTILAEFTRLYPAVVATVDLTGRRVDLIEEGYDVALRAGVLPSSTLVARRLGVGKAGLYASPEYLAAHGEPDEPHALAGRRTLHNRSGEGAVVWRLDASGGRAEEVALTPAVRSNDVAVLADLALAGAGIARLPTFAAAAHVRLGRLRPVLPDWTAERVELHAVYPSHKGLAPAVRAFVDLAARRLREVVPQD